MKLFPGFAITLWILTLGLAEGHAYGESAGGRTVPDLPAATVKVQSYPCAAAGQLSRYKQGSGTLIRKGADVFVLTSNHVLYPQSRDQAHPALCYDVSAENQQTYRTTFVAANFLQGLALLKVVEPSQQDASALEALALPVAALATVPPAADAELTFKGFPFAAPLGARASEYHAKVIDAHSQRTSLVVPYVLEMDGLSEYGLSGGTVLDENGTFVGMLSHQILRIQEGRPTVADARAPDTAGPVITLALPAPVIEAWLNDVWAGKATADLRYDQDLAVEQNTDGASLGGLLFQENHCSTQSDLLPGGRGIGGHGVGIGGGESSLNLAMLGQCVISVTSRPTGSADDSQPWPWDDKTPLNVLKAALAGGGGEVFIRGAMKETDVLPAETLPQVLTLFKEGYLPMISTTQPRTMTTTLLNQGQLEDTLAFFDGIALANQDAFAKRAAELDRASPKEVEAAWNADTAKQKIEDYIAIAHAKVQHSTRLAVYRLAVQTALAAEASVVVSGGRSIVVDAAHVPTDSWSQLFPRLELKFLDELWNVSTPTERVELWNEVLPTDFGKMTLFIALSAFPQPNTPPPADFWALASDYMARIEGIWLAAVAANQQEAEWAASGNGRRYWLMYVVGTVYKTQQPKAWQKLQAICPNYPAMTNGATKN